MARFEHPHDRQMRHVPDRPGLLARLRDVAVADDALDEWLLMTPPCDGLESRIREAVLADTQEVAQLLLEVPEPEGLLERLQQVVVEEALSDSGMTDMLRDVQPSDSAVNLEGLLAQGLSPNSGGLNEISKHVDVASKVGRMWRPVAERRRRQNRWLGASLAMAAICVQAAALLAVALVSWPLNQSPNALAVPEVGPLELGSQLSDESVLVFSDPLEPPAEPAEDPLPFDLAALDLPQAVLVDELSAASQGTDLAQDVWATRMEHVGYPTRESEKIGELAVASPPAQSGAPMGTRGYDRVFHFRSGTSPWVVASALPKQQLSLHARPDVFRRALQRITMGRYVGPEEVRVEDALGLVSIPTASKPGRLQLQATGGPSVFGEPGAGLLQLMVAAGASAQRQVAPVDLVVVLDASERMAWSELQRVRAALAATLRAMRAKDRLSIMTVGGPPQLVCERAGVDDAAAVDRALAMLSPEGIADWGRALPEAARVAMEHDGAQGRRVLLLIGAGDGEWAESSEPWMNRTLSNLQSQMEVRACCLKDAGDADDADDADSAPRWVQWLRTSQTPVVSGPDAARKALLEATAGQVVPVGRNVQFEVEFNPAAVAAYRVIGQDGSPADWNTGPQPLEMFAGEQRNSLLELRWASNDVDNVGWAEVHWQDAQGRTQKDRQRISRLQFATSFSQSAASLQQAALFAEAAQVWRGSPFALGSKKRLERIRDWVWECAPAVRNSPETQRLLLAISRSLQHAASTNN